MIDCREVMAKLWDYLDDELPRGEFEALREHIAVCKRCSPQYRFELAFLEALAAVKGSMPEPPRALRARVQALAGSST